jgi:hypothetical protein
MKKFILVLIIAVAVIVPAAAQLRIDVGLYKPLGIGFTEVPEVNSELDDINKNIASQIWLMIPEVGAYYQFGLDPLPIRFGIGGRAYTAIVATVVWPNAFAEVQLGPLFVEAQLGGLFFGYYVLNTVGGEFGKVFIPDLSAWFAFGEKKTFRIGAGVTMFYAPDAVAALNDATGGRDIVPFIYYASAKFSIKP